MARAKRKAPTKRAARGVVGGMATDWYWEQDADLRFTHVQVRSGDPVEQALASRIIGKRRWETGIEIEGGWDAHRAVLEARQPFRDVLMWRKLEDGSDANRWAITGLRIMLAGHVKDPAIERMLERLRQTA